MRFWLALGALVVGMIGPARAADVEIKGPHICCGSCVNAVKDILAKVDGVSNVKADAKTKTVNFTAKDDGSAKAGAQALVAGGFFGVATQDGKSLPINVPSVPKGDKVASITVNDVHVCCGACQVAVKKAFPDAKVTFTGKGAQRNITLEGAGRSAAAVIDALHQAGFHGKVAK